MSLKNVFQKKITGGGADRLRDAILNDDLLAVDRLMKDVALTTVAGVINKTVAAMMTPQVAAVISGPNGVTRAPGDVMVTGTVAKPDLFLHLLGALLETNNVRALDVVIRKEKASFNGWSGTEAMVRIIDAPVRIEDKLRFLETLLEQGHDRMTFPERAVLAAASRNMHPVVDMLATKGLMPKRMPLVIPQPEPSWR